MLRMDAQLGTIASLICTAAGIKAANGTAMTPADFAPYLKDEPEKEELTVPTIDDLKAAFGIK